MHQRWRHCHSDRKLLMRRACMLHTPRAEPTNPSQNAVDSLSNMVAVAAGAGGHAGTWSPFALIAEIRQFFDKTLLLAGCLNQGHEILAAQLLGADLDPSLFGLH